MITIAQAVQALGGKSFSVEEENPNKVFFNRGNPLNITTAQIKEKFEELVAELNQTEPIRLLREQRDKLLTETDWVTAKAMETEKPIPAEWKTYRQALRDLPATAEPQLDENGKLTNVTWPEKPE